MYKIYKIAGGPAGRPAACPEAWPWARPPGQPGRWLFCIYHVYMESICLYLVYMFVYVVSALL